MNSLYSYKDNTQELQQKLNTRKAFIADPENCDNLSQPLIDNYKICRVLDDEYFPQYFAKQPSQLAENIVENKIDKTLALFKKEVLNALKEEKNKFRLILKEKKIKFKNIFEYSGSENLYLSNIYTRFISENLGHKLEDIAEISPQVLIPEKELNIYLKGIDLIIYDQGVIKYTQLKTKKDTLTGSQSQRSIDELRIHPHAIFAAALDMGKSWHPSAKLANPHNIKLLAGSDFWSIIGLNYNLILDKTSKTIKELDEELYQ